MIVGLGDALGGVRDDFMQMLAALGILFAFVFLFWIWGVGGTWMITALLALIAVGWLLYKAWNAGYINI